VTLVTGASVRGSRLTVRGIRPVFADARCGSEHDLLVVADGARSALRAAQFTSAHRPYPWGALWFVGSDPQGLFAGSLRQVAESTTTLLGFLPCGVGPRRGSGEPVVSLFWSVPVASFGRRDFDLARWKTRVQALEPRAADLLAQIEDPAQLLEARYFDVTMPRFHAERLVFIGDAAHATSPQLGQGTNLALEDARVLAACVSSHRELSAALERFSRARRAHVRFYQRASWGLTPFFQSDFGALAALRDAAFGPLCRFGPTRRLMLRTLAGVQLDFWGRSLPPRPIRARLSRIQPQLC
jgi:2-polyprenyl-6-methoxyphenol hydroxylase-like FAD-dependent oxidoreductase